MIKSEAINLVSVALVKAQSEMGSASKGSSNPFFKSKYADLNSIREACLPALFLNGLSVIQPTVVIDGKNYIETLVIHESGQYIGGHTEIVFSKQNDAQNFGAGTTYARRFGLQALLCIGAEDLDGEDVVGRGRTNNVQSKPPTPTIGTATSEVRLAEPTVELPKKGFGVKTKPSLVENAVITKANTTDAWE